MSENNQSGEAELATSNTKTEVNKLEKSQLDVGEQS